MALQNFSAKSCPIGISSVVPQADFMNALVENQDAKTRGDKTIESKPNKDLKTNTYYILLCIKLA